ncbi:MAG TPA: P-loop NTPase [Gaiellaceae bacterium]|nr:P-loop NTPase [Gaiellaceae bacterium]
MSDTIRVLAVLAEHADRRLVEAALEGEPALEVIGYAEHLDDWQDLLEQGGDVVVVACQGHSEGATYMVDRAVKHRPDRPVVVLAESSPNGFLREAFEAGADDVLTLPLAPQQVLFDLQKVIARRKGLATPGKASAPLIVILGPKGGTGKTLVATNLAVALAERDANVVLVDLDLQFGDIGLALGLSPERTMYDLMKAGPPFDHDKLDRHLMRHSSGVKVLIAPTRPDHASAVSIDYLRDVYASLRTMCDAVIVDTPPGFTSEVIATIDVSSDACIVGMLDSLSLKNTKLGIETLDLMGYPTEHVTLLLNRADSRVGITPDDVSTIVGRVPDVFVPSDREIPRSVNEGTPVVASRERSDAAKAFRALADRFARTPTQAPTPLSAPSSAGAMRMLIGRRRK